ncbi:amino acid ABC transporter permease [Thermus sp. 2.9]|uniref:ABC transporter permease subunit n=1 Tax=Thermus sp. (strain 2.9) TaxID=1577051 RepID=UPI000543CD85|nr:ABC transporter permease subunit [Thermus sp. 2.9]KHG64350.1 amino acid ABC transporter permease [Thermus sp. 2.9]
MPRLRDLLVQAMVLGLVAWGLAALWTTAKARMAAQGIPFSFAFLSQEAGFSLSEGITFAPGEGFRPYQPSDTYLQALLAGFLNTLKVTLLGLLGATLLGLLLALGRLSANPLARGLSFAYVEAVRNTPLLLQLFVWYFAILLKLPPWERGIAFAGAFLSQRGLLLPELALAPGAWGLVLAGVWAWAFRRRGLLARVGSLALFLASWALLGPPFSVRPAVPGPFGPLGGIFLSPEYAALLIGVTLYTSAFVAEVVRGAILAVPKGQWEAAYALGLSYPDTFRLVVLPQAVRIAVPPLANQYLNLAKNTSLGVAVGYPDLFSVYSTVANQSGRSLEAILLVMAVYLSLSLSISALVNGYNRRVALRWKL